MNHKEAEKTITRLFDTRYVAAVRVTEIRMAKTERVSGVSLPPEIAVCFEALLLDGGRVRGSLNLISMAVGSALKAEEQIEKIKAIKKKKEENSIDFLAELKTVEDE